MYHKCDIANFYLSKQSLDYWYKAYQIALQRKDNDSNRFFNLFHDITSLSMLMGSTYADNITVGLMKLTKPVFYSLMGSVQLCKGIKYHSKPGLNELV